MFVYSMADNVDEGRYAVKPDTDIIQPQTSADIPSDEATIRWCEPCCFEYNRRTKAVSYCPECNALFCQACNGAHAKLPTSWYHGVLSGSKMPVSNAVKPVKYPACEIHPGEHKKYHCVKHGTMICRICAKKKHDITCRITPISDICAEIGGSDVDNLKEDVHTTRELITDTILALDHTVHEIKLQNETLLSKLDDAFIKMKSKADNLCTEQCSIYSENQVFLSGVRDSLDNTLAKIDTVAKCTAAEHLFLHMQGIVERMHCLSKNVEESIREMRNVASTYSPNEILGSFALDLSSLGDVEATFKQTHYTSLPLPKTSFPRFQVNITRMNAKKLTSMDVKIPEDQFTCNIKGLTARNDGSLILSDFDNQKIKLISPDLLLTTCLTLPASPTDVCEVKNKIIVVPTNASTLHFMDISNPESIPVRFDKPLNLEYTVWACASYKDDLIVAAETEPTSVKLIDMSGQEKMVTIN